MLAFIDFEASSLGKHGYPIEVGWVREDGAEAGFLIRPALGWDDWSAEAEAIHGIDRPSLLKDGVAIETVVGALLAALDGHDVLASAPSWDGKWLSLLLRAADRPRHLLRLRDTEEALAAAVRDRVGPDADDAIRQALAAAAAERTRPVHRALADAQMEWRAWQAGIAAVAGRPADAA